VTSPSTAGAIPVLAGLAGLDISADNHGALERSLEQYLIALRKIPLKDMLEVDPGLTFDPSWQQSDDDV
jgi:hypothetical protein